MKLYQVLKALQSDVKNKNGGKYPQPLGFSVTLQNLLMLPLEKKTL